MKKGIIKIIKWSLLLTYLVVMLSFINRKDESLNCVNLKITIDDSHRFIDSASIVNALIRNNITIDSCNIDALDFNNIETIIETNPSVNNAEVYTDFNGVLNISVKQRNPIMRIITKNNNSFYIDDKCKLMPMCDRYTANVIIINGEISERFLTSMNSPTDISNDEHKYPFTLQDLYTFVSFLNENELWKYQIEQIYINEDKEFELIPRVGNHIIILGKLDNFKFKLGKLEAIYKKGFAQTDWNIYSTINLKYSNQVICKKR